MTEESKDRIPGAPADLPFAEESSSTTQADPPREPWTKRKGISLAEARLAGKRASAAKYGLFLKQFRELVEGGEYSTSVLARRLRVTPPTIINAAKRCGYSLPALRAARDKANTAAVDTQTPKEQDTQGKREGLICSWGWSILQLFDRLQPFFDGVEQSQQDDVEDDTVEDIAVEDTRLTWTAWRVFLAAAFGVAREALAVDWDEEKRLKLGRRPAYPVYPGLPAVDVPRGAANIPPGASVDDIYRACTGRTTWPSMQARLVSLIVGRRGGKSYLTAIIGIYLACCRTYKVKLGTKGMVMILARDKEQAGVIRNYILAFLKAVPELAEMLSDTPTKTSIELRNGLVIEVRAAGPEGTRGYTVVAALADEIAFWPTDPESAKQDKKILRALRPAMLAVEPKPMIVMLSSPYARRGVLHENHRKDYGKDGARGLVWQADTLSMRPTQDEEVIQEIRDQYEDDPDSAKAEYGAEFRSDLESIFTQTSVEAVAQPGRIEQARSTKHRYRAFVDPSGGSSDSYVLAIAHDETRKVDGEMVTFAVLDKVREWVPKFDPAEVSREVVQICRDFGIRKVIGDAYGGEWPRDPLKKSGLDYELSKLSRSEIYLAGVPLVNSRRCEILDADHHKKLVNQLVNLERRTGRTGKDTIDHPPGSHDDVANAVMGVLVTGRGATGARCTWDEEDDLLVPSE